MKKKDVLKSYRIDKLDDETVFIQGRDFNFSYTKADGLVKEEYVGLYRYFGGLQCNFAEGSVDFKLLESWLIELAEKILG